MYDVKFDYTNKIAEIEIPEGISVIDDVLDGYRNYQTLSVAWNLMSSKKSQKMDHLLHVILQMRP
mgnify:CR=1 FL=1|jgi:hypothetical protein